MCFFQALEEEETMTPEQLAIKNVGKQVSYLLYLAVLIILTIVGSLLKRKIKKEKLASGDDFNIDEVKKDF